MLDWWLSARSGWKAGVKCVATATCDPSSPARVCLRFGEGKATWPACRPTLTRPFPLPPSFRVGSDAIFLRRTGPSAPVLHRGGAKLPLPSRRRNTTDLLAPGLRAVVADDQRDQLFHSCRCDQCGIKIQGRLWRRSTNRRFTVHLLAESGGERGCETPRREGRRDAGVEQRRAWPDPGLAACARGNGSGVCAEGRGW